VKESNGKPIYGLGNRPASSVVPSKKSRWDHDVSSPAEYLIEKSFDDFADDIEAVTIHYVCSPTGEDPDWDRERVSRLMRTENRGEPEVEPRRRVRTLRLPAQIVTKAGVATDRYLLHHYFEYWQDGSRHYSPHYVEEITTGLEANKW
jgi:hypothetical protein